MNDNAPSNKPRSNELRLHVPCAECAVDLNIRKTAVAWTDSFECSEGHRNEAADVMAALSHDGWNVHDLTRGSGTIRRRVRSLPMPHGGSFVAGDTLQRSDTADRRGEPHWPFRAVDTTRPAEKGFRPVP